MALYREDPVLWIEERLGQTLWSAQKDICRSLVANKNTAIKSCHGIGKSQLAAWLVCWWVDVHPSADTVVVTTAPSSDQVRKIMWEYIRKTHAEFGLRGTVSEQAEWKDERRNIVAYGRKPSDTNMNVIQGEHKKYTLVLIDEAGGVPPNIWVGADAITTMPTNRILAIGNPDNPNTKFGRIFLEPEKYPEWKTFTVSAFDSPNFTDEGATLPAELCAKLISREWVEAQRVQWGEKDMLYITRVLAEFPESATDALFDPASLAASRDAELVPSTAARPKLGVDVARFGEDRTVVVSNTDGVIEIVDSWDKTDTMETVDRVHNIAMRMSAKEVFVDGTGVGAGVVDALAVKPQGIYTVVEVTASNRSPDDRQWGNYRAFLYDNLRRLVRDKAVQLPALDPDREVTNTLNDELLGIRYKVKPGTNIMMIESKDEARRRGVKSPDFADAVTYACAPFDVDDPFAEYNDGDTYTVDAFDVIEDELIDSWAISPV